MSPFQLSRYQRLAVSLLGLLTLISSVSSCRLQARPPGWIEPGTGAMSLGCLDGALETLTHFVQGKAQTNEVTAVFGCVETTLTAFTQMVKGSQPGAYTAQDLRNLIQNYFLRQFRITDALFTEALRLKQAFLGGPAGQLSSGDLKRIRELLTLMGRHAGMTAEYQPILPANVALWNGARLDQALGVINQAGEEIARWVDQAAGTYRFSEFESLLSRMEETGAFNGTDAGHLIQEIRKWLPFIRTVKALVIDGDADELKPTDWGLIVRLGTRGYAVALRANHLAAHATTWVSGDDRSRLVGLVRNGLGVISEALQRRPGQEITATAMVHAMETLPLKLPLRSQTIRSLLSVVLDRFFGDSLPQLFAPGHPTRLDQKNLKQIIRDFETWAQVQEEIDTRLMQPEKSAVREYEAPLVTIPREEVQRIYQSLDRPRQSAPVFYFQPSEPPTYKLHLSGFNRGAPLTAWEFSVKNWTRALAQIIVRGYAPRANQWKERLLTFNEFYNLYLDIEPALKEAQLLNDSFPLNEISLNEIYFLADLVGFSSNGDGKVGANEIADLAVVFFSSVSMGEHVEKLVQEHCVAPITAACAKVTLGKYFEVAFPNFPDLLKDWRSWSLDQRRETIQYTEFLALKRNKADDEPYGIAEYIGIGVALHQLELMFTQYDTNSDNVATEGEVMRAFPLFASMLKEMSVKKGGAMGGLVDGKLLESLFSHIVAKDEDPQKDILSLLAWNFFPEMRKKHTQVKRVDLIRRFAKLRKENPPEL